MLSAKNRQKNKNIQPGPEKQDSYKGVSTTQTSKTQTSDHRPRKCRPRKHRPRKRKPRKRRPRKHRPCKQRRVTNTLNSLCSRAYYGRNEFKSHSSSFLFLLLFAVLFPIFSNFQYPKVDNERCYRAKKAVDQST